jgi:hypothetical protein
MDLIYSVGAREESGHPRYADSLIQYQQGMRSCLTESDSHIVKYDLALNHSLYLSSNCLPQNLASFKSVIRETFMCYNTKRINLLDLFAAVPGKQLA